MKNDTISLASLSDKERNRAIVLLAANDFRGNFGRRAFQLGIYGLAPIHLYFIDKAHIWDKSMGYKLFEHCKGIATEDGIILSMSDKRYINKLCKNKEVIKHLKFILNYYLDPEGYPSEIQNSKNHLQLKLNKWYSTLNSLKF